MSETVIAVYDGQVLRTETPLDLEANTRYLAPITPVDVSDPQTTAWDVLDSLAGSVDAPADWAKQHDHYLYGNLKRRNEVDQ